MIYLIDTNIIGDLIKFRNPTSEHAAARFAAKDTLGLCYPVYYEFLRGILWKQATGMFKVFNRRVLPRLEWIELTNADWEQAARFWAEARRSGKQLGDPDLLLAALAYRLNAVIVSADSDFDALSVRRENWRD
jgi:predicted nucleic acid-binding protein